MVLSFDPALNLIYVGTSVTSPAPKFMLGGADRKHLYHNSTLALDADTGTASTASLFGRLTPEIRPSAGNNLFVFALPD